METENMSQTQQQPQQQDATAIPVNINMTVGQWGRLLEHLAGLRWADVNPYIVEIQRHMQAAVSASQGMPPRTEIAHPGNGTVATLAN
jgi:hypothetical protein